jgi:phosphate transport system protein
MSRAQYDEELESIRQNLLRMGETTELLLSGALNIVSEPNVGLVAKASELEAQTDHHHRLIHDQCLTLITRRAPVARDARLVTGVLDAIVDLELIGDYAYEIVTLTSGMKARPPLQILAQIARIGAKVEEIVKAAVDNWRDGVTMVSVKQEETAIRGECGALYEKLSQLTAAPGDASPYVDLMLVTRHLERISRHAVCVADQAMSAAPMEPLRETTQA